MAPSVETPFPCVKSVRNECSCLYTQTFQLLTALDFGHEQQQKSDVKIKPRKGRPTMKTSTTKVPEDEEEDMRGLLSSRSLGREALEELSELGQDASPPLKPKRRLMLSCLSHAESCSCPCCTDPSLARVSVLWALTQADTQSEEQGSRRLRHIAKRRCHSISTKLHARLAVLVPVKSPEKPCMLQAEVVKTQLSTVLTLLCCGVAASGKAATLWEEIEAGLKAVEPKGAVLPELGPLKAALLGAKAVACCLALAGKNQCSPEELFCSVWGWTPPGAHKLKTQVKPRGKSSSSDKPLSTTAPSSKNLTDLQREACTEPVSKKNKEVTMASSTKTKKSVPRINITKPATVFKTPRATRTPRPRPVQTPASTATDLSAFDFTNDVPDITVSSTPLPAAKVANSRSCAVTKSKDVPKGSFQIFEDSSPLQEKRIPVPAAPKRTQRSRFKV